MIKRYIDFDKLSLKQCENLVSYIFDYADSFTFRFPNFKHSTSNNLKIKYDDTVQINNEFLDYITKNNDLIRQCESCKNFYKNVKLISNDIRDFVEQFGIDISKPIEQESILADKSNKMVDNTVYYAVNGKANSLDNCEIHIGKSVVEIIPNEMAPNTDIFEPYFVFAVHDIWLPWTVDYDINDIYD